MYLPNKMFLAGNGDETELILTINSSVTTIPVEDVSVFPSAPNFATLGRESGAEVIYYTDIDTTNNALLNCSRGQSGTINNSWVKGTPVYTAYTSANHNAIVNNIVYASSQIINPNLLINPRFSVRQRGSTFTNPTNQYTADRWRCNGTGVIAIDSTGFRVNSGNVNIVQVMEDNDFNQIKNTPCTLTYSKNGVVTSAQTTPTNAKVVDLNLTAGDTLNWVKLEQGASFTSLNFRSYGEEFRDCQRYFNPSFLFSGYPNREDIWVPSASFPVEMRVAPTVKANASQLGFSGYGAVTFTSITFSVGKESIGMASINWGGNKPILVIGVLGLTLDAEIY